MFSPKALEDIARQFVDSLPPGFKTLNQEMKQQLNLAMQQWLSKMSLVTQEEFDIQCQVLLKTRLKLDELQAKVADLYATKNPE